LITPAAKWKAAERARYREARRVAVTHYVYPEDREKVARYIKRLVKRTERARAQTEEGKERHRTDEGEAGAR
jgi:predicted RNA binding protein with dsRBD fold (UPF0201 family)